MAVKSAAKSIYTLSESHWGLDQDVRNDLRVVSKAALCRDESQEVAQLKYLIVYW